MVVEFGRTWSLGGRVAGLADLRKIWLGWWKVVAWMRNGRWTRETDYGEGSASASGFPPQPQWFDNNADFPNIRNGLENIGFTRTEADRVMGGNWLDFFQRSFGPDS